ncbi:hypothetical protein E2C01_014602 [Portunus trituberculatus]|uniref:Uncharacterized protein n=1 Tax=Portunus trituberculatus TaxID=210409 RepID=A0A5B7DKH0_PORTR|nr:hypothetical protein [Portunus trituberculatus]
MKSPRTPQPSVSPGYGSRERENETPYFPKSRALNIVLSTDHKWSSKTDKNITFTYNIVPSPSFAGMWKEESFMKI